MKTSKPVRKMAVFSLALFLVTIFTSCDNPFMERILQIKKVYFDTDGDGVVDKEAFLYRGETVKPPALPNMPKYAFDGWYNDSDFTQEWDFDAVPTGSMTLFAKWELVGDGGDGEDGGDGGDGEDGGDNGTVEGGDGSVEHPFEIDNNNAGNILQGIGKDPNYPLDAHYVLTGHIVLTGQNNWIPIGDEDKPFTGSFNGNGYTITGMHINTTNGKKGQSMFSNAGIGKDGTTQAVVKNFGLIDVYIDNVGGINEVGLTGVVVATNKGILENIYIVGNTQIRGSGDFVGGIVGKNETGGIVRNCFISVMTLGANAPIGKAGGIVGENKGTVENSFVLRGNIYGVLSFGRIAGDSSSGMLTNNYAHSDVAKGDNGSVIDGADITTAQAKSQGFWKQAGFAFGSGDGQWVWNGDSHMPTLRSDAPKQEWNLW